MPHTFMHNTDDGPSQVVGTRQVVDDVTPYLRRHIRSMDVVIREIRHHPLLNEYHCLQNVLARYS